jgi:hypothetical protein
MFGDFWSEKNEPPMQSIIQQLTLYFQQISARFPLLPVSMLIFFLVVLAFLSLALVFLLLRLLWGLGCALFGVKRRRRARGADPQWERQKRLNSLRQQYLWSRENH